MTFGRLEVKLLNANGLEDSDFLSKMDPYVIVTCGSLPQRSRVAKGHGANPEWGETFLFSIYRDVEALYLRVMDKDTLSADDLVGDAKILLKEVFETGSMPPAYYEITKDGVPKGKVRVGLTFTPENSHAEA